MCELIQFNIWVLPLCIGTTLEHWTMQHSFLCLIWSLFRVRFFDFNLFGNQSLACQWSSIVWKFASFHPSLSTAAATTTVTVDPVWAMMEPMDSDRMNCARNTMQLTMATSVPMPRTWGGGRGSREVPARDASEIAQISLDKAKLWILFFKSWKWGCQQLCQWKCQNASQNLQIKCGMVLHL